ncbi:hypothetical protein PTTG_03173 [Puccinia triticina 1-1 BBBD Race 1]|uniref:protein-tyrosine-phosphatase n=2 Tax=Puccinia triticina TaxID=208348 RepID=A0A180GYY8_PUCT1|nr:uncharacterized protein PtA15_15A456 [Puccinia triticina]OAV97950.1 hypothetical protein PTTG_03173 [Puccinia triticina 1-1 BBBD Race 1]WAQ92060.1 hypothetical protein PtA15_15A456 [Puccinia triticina]WAR62875.1 hypothetical protein PtB15_15B463 [Puccinia triticina]
MDHQPSSPPPQTQTQNIPSNPQQADCLMADVSTKRSNLPIQPVASGSSSPIRSPSSAISQFGPRLGLTCFPNPIPDPLTLNSTHGIIQSNLQPVYWFTIDSLLIYLSFYQDTGPLNCACLYRFCLHLHELLEDSSMSDRRIILYSSDDPDKKANAALLMALYCMIVLRWSVADALHPISHLEVQPFRDAGYSRADFNLSIQNVLFGVKKAIDLRLLKLEEFDLKEYETFEKVEHGDYNWLSPHFIAFASPVESANGRIGKAFKLILDQFERVGVKLVIRLNKKLYDETRFTKRGMAHREMYFDDGTNPSMEMVREFITISERIIEEGGVVAVHCKAGLGRTGTLIGAYLIYKYRFTAEEAIGFMRIMRPGTCVGPQQHFLYENQLTWVEWAARDELLAEQQTQISPSKTERPITPPPESLVPAIALSSATSTPPPKSQTAGTTAMPTSVVPGQPRKTPGAKTRHMVAAPEGKQTGKSLIEQEEAQEQTSDGEGEEEPPVMPNRPVTRQVLAHKLAPGSPVKTSNPAPTAKTRPRPASAMSDHRPRTTAPVPGLVRRSKAVKDLGTLFEGTSTKAGDPKSSAIPTRYNLRGVGTRAVSAASSNSANQANSANTPTSPSRLPQRIAGVKKRGCTATGPSNVHKDELLNLRVTEVRNGTSHHHLRDHKHLNGAPNNLNPLDRRNVGASLGLDEDQRSVRRRRSSLSHTDLAI